MKRRRRPRPAEPVTTTDRPWPSCQEVEERARLARIEERRSLALASDQHGTYSVPSGLGRPGEPAGTPDAKNADHPWEASGRG